MYYEMFLTHKYKHAEEDPACVFCFFDSVDAQLATDEPFRIMQGAILD